MSAGLSALSSMLPMSGMAVTKPGSELPVRLFWRICTGALTLALHQPPKRADITVPKALNEWCPGADLNHRHADFQSAALPTELPGHR